MKLSSKNKNLTVKYDNDFQKINISKLTANEFRIWMYFLISVKDKGDKEVTLTFSEIREKVGIVLNKEEMFEYLKIAADKLLTQRIAFSNEENDKFIMFSFFTKFEADKNKQKLVLRVNNEFLWIVNNIIKNYSILSWNDIKKIKSKYSLIIYKKIKEFYNLEKLEFTFEKFKDFLGLNNKPNRYINDKIIPKLEKELPNFFNNFKIEKIKSGKTCPIEKFIFKWKTEKQNYNFEENNEIDSFPSKEFNNFW